MNSIFIWKFVRHNDSRLIFGFNLQIVLSIDFIFLVVLFNDATDESIRIDLSVQIIRSFSSIQQMNHFPQLIYVRRHVKFIEIVEE